MQSADAAIRGYQRAFHKLPSVVSRAPGRVNLIGEHTDYTQGWVLPFAIQRTVEVAAGPGTGKDFQLFSSRTGQSHVVPPGPITHDPAATWGNYARGVISALVKRGFEPRGADILIDGDLLIGAGLSSSAALTVGLAFALSELAQFTISRREVVDVAREAENDFVGMPCGLMDPYASVYGVAGHAILLDCLHARHEEVPLALDGAKLVLLNSGVRHRLAEGGYGERVAECQQVLEHFHVRSARDLPQDATEVLNRKDPSSAGSLGRRARHLISENRRVHDMVGAMRAKEIHRMGDLLNESHLSLRDDFEVSCAEIEDLRNKLLRSGGVIGARMVGGGFGGCVLTLVEEAHHHDLVRRFSIEAADRVIDIESGDGAAVAHV